MSKSIYRDNFETSREVWVEVGDDRVTMIQQDLGPGCGMFGSDEYEREVSCLRSHLERAMGVSGEDALADILGSMFNTADALDRFEDYLAAQGVEFTYYSC